MRTTTGVARAGPSAPPRPRCASPTDRCYPAALPFNRPASPRSVGNARSVRSDRDSELLHLDRFLELLGWTKRHLLAGLDLHALTGCRIAAHAGFAGFDLKDA